MTSLTDRSHYTVYVRGYYGAELLYEGYDEAAALRTFRTAECEYLDCKMWSLFSNGEVALQYGKNSKSQWKRT